MTKLIQTVSEIVDFRAEAREKTCLVPTMGALHAGHLSLIKRARGLVGAQGLVIVSNFVNPLQFGPGEDYEKYPRSLQADLELISDFADAMFAPSVQEMYPVMPPLLVNTGELGAVFEGAARPGHFDGVATVVLKLFNLLRPEIAIFGQKDAQQLAILRRLNADFNCQVEIVGLPIVREDSGLARSSRNEYFTHSQRQDALALFEVIKQAKSASNLRQLLQILQPHDDGLKNSHAVLWDYAKAVDPKTLQAVAADFAGNEVLVLLAAKVHGVRLIDNELIFFNK